MKNETKLEKVKKFLAENNIEYKTRDKHIWGKSDLYLPKFGIHIKIEGDDDSDFYKRCFKFFPVFVRSTETPKFVIEKVQNTIIKSMQRQQVKLMKDKNRIYDNRK